MRPSSDLFSGTADHYALHRSGLPDEVARLLADVAPGPRLLDLGTGTGLVVSALLPRGMDDVLALDPDPDLLAQAARSLAGPIADGRVRLAAGRAEDLALPEDRQDWRPDLVTACRAFHWMDQPVVARRVLALLSTGGIFAVLGNGSLWGSSVPWKVAARETVQSFLGEARRAGSGTYRHSGIDWADLLREVGFDEVSEQHVEVHEERPLADLVPYLHSFSFAAPGLFGDRLAEFDAALVERITPYAVDGALDDSNSWHMIVARA